MSSSDSDSGRMMGAAHRTRMIHLDAGQQRMRDANCRTIVVPFDPWEGARVPYEALFLAHYRAMRELARGFATPGLAVVAVHVPSCRLAGRMWLSARAGAPRTAVVGRHSEADLLLEDPSLSLRHLLVVVPPPERWEAGALGYEVIDLRTEQAFQDERGRRLEGLAAEGPAFVSCGSYALFLLPTGDPTDWPELATDAWSMLPARVHVHEREAEPDRWRRGAYGRALRPAGGPRRDGPSGDGSRFGGRAGSVDGDRAERSSVVTIVPAPLSAGEPLLAEGEEAIGLLRVETARGVTEMPVGPSAAARGVLLGRYPRCDAADLLKDEAVSRSHLLVQRVGEDIVAIDTASTHGTFREGDPRRVRVVSLGDGEVALVAGDRGRVIWTWAG